MLNNNWVLIALAGACLVQAIRALLRAASLQGALGWLKLLPRISGAAVWASGAVVFGSLLVFNASFTAFSERTLVARVVAVRPSESLLELRYTWPNQGQERSVSLAGDQWSVRGGIVRWNPALRLLGLRTCHKPFAFLAKPSEALPAGDAPAEYKLTSLWLDAFWKLLGWADRNLGFVKATIDTADYVAAQPGISQEVYVTETGGYFIKRGSR